MRGRISGRCWSLLLVSFVLVGGACESGSPSPEAPAAVDGPSAAFVRVGAALCYQGPTTDGVDVSYWQGTIDWTRVADDGITFGIARVAHGEDFDSVFERNWEGMRANGIIRGAYTFYEPLNDLEEQARLVTDTLGALGDGDLPVTVDVEWPHDDGDPTEADLRWLIATIEEATGKKPMIYTARSYWNEYFTDEFGDHDLWVANWNVSCPSIPTGWDEWTFWQTTGGGGDVDGISGGVDTDVFRGNLADLQVAASFPARSWCSIRRGMECYRQGCACVDDACEGGACEGTGCTDEQTAACEAEGCGCVDGRCAGGLCDGTGCTARERAACVAEGCGCIDHVCAGGNCVGTGCTAAMEGECAADGCACADGRCSGGACAGTGCTPKEQRDCEARGCACLEHACAGGSCGGSGCTAAQEAACAAEGAECVLGACVTATPCDGVSPLPAEVCVAGRRYRCAADGSSTLLPTPVETCNGADDDCDGATDEELGVGEPCTAGTGACTFEGVRACAASGLGVVCSAVTPPCDDENPCTLDGCDPATGCTNTPADAWCEDGDACTLGDRCTAGACVPGPRSGAPECGGGPDVVAPDVPTPRPDVPAADLAAPDVPGPAPDLARTDLGSPDVPVGTDVGASVDAVTPELPGSGGGGCAAGGAPGGGALGLLLLFGMALLGRRRVA